MTAYLILNYNVDDSDQYRDYQKAAAPALRIPDECQPIVLDGASESIEGDATGAQTVVLRFESKEKAREIYESGEYQSIIGMRHTATSQHFAVLVDGLG